MTEINENLRLLEALLFAAPEPMSLSALQERLPEGTDTAALLKQLQEMYTSRGIHLTESAGLYAFRTAPDLANHLRLEKDVQKKLSRAAMETLAIIAYHQPVTRAEVENIRGVTTHRGTLDVLIECGWVKPGRRRETPGRPLTWMTTPSFLDHFGLESVMDLPGMDELKASGLLDRRPAIETLPQDDLFTGQEREEGVEDLWPQGKEEDELEGIE